MENTRPFSNVTNTRTPCAYYWRQRDFLLSLAIEGLYRPLWSSAILSELEEHEGRKLVNRGMDRIDAERSAQQLTAKMGGAFDDACVEGWEPLDGSYGLPDPDDEHLVAAAVVAGLARIVTVNLRDLPQDKLPSHPRSGPLGSV